MPHPGFTRPGQNKPPFQPGPNEYYERDRLNAELGIGQTIIIVVILVAILLLAWGWLRKSERGSHPRAASSGYSG